MGYGGPIGLLVAGLILALAFTEQTLGPLKVQVLGWILVAAGGLWLLLTIAQMNSRRRTVTTAVTTDAHGRQASTQRSTESDPPAPPVV